MRLVQHTKTKTVHIPNDVSAWSRPGHIWRKGRSVCGVNIAEPTFKEIEGDPHTIGPLCQKCRDQYPY